MKITASGGTDAANIVLFWPDNLPADADVVLKNDPIALVKKLEDEGKIVWFPCGSDGSYSIAIYVRSEVPEDLIVYCKNEEKIPSLIVHGNGFFSGMEYMFKNNPGLAEKYAGMCEQVQIPDGNYSARVYCTEVPETLYDSWLSKHAGAGAKRLWKIHGIIVAFSVVGVLASLVAFFAVTWTVWFYILAIAATLVLSAVGMSHTDWYKTVSKARNAFGKEYPSYVIHLE
jgi:hypothetical protein